MKGLLVASAGTLALLELGWNQMMHVVLAILLLVVNLFTISGVHARRLWSHRSAAKGGLLLLASAAAVIIFAFTTIPAIATEAATRRMTVPASAPPFSMTASDGREIDSRALRGSVVVLDFWATWCPACRRELPELDKLYRRYQNDSSVSFWALDVLGNGETTGKAKEFMRKAGYALPVAFAGEKCSEDLGGPGLPSLVVLDKLGRTRLVHKGYDRSELLQRELSKEIETLLHEN